MKNLIALLFFIFVSCNSETNINGLYVLDKVSLTKSITEEYKKSTGITELSGVEQLLINNQLIEFYKEIPGFLLIKGDSFETVMYQPGIRKIGSAKLPFKLEEAVKPEDEEKLIKDIVLKRLGNDLSFPISGEKNLTPIYRKNNDDIEVYKQKIKDHKITF